MNSRRAFVVTSLVLVALVAQMGTARALVDTDGDGVDDEFDNCPAETNPFQHDLDADGLGDPCDPTDDGIVLGTDVDDELIGSTAPDALYGEEGSDRLDGGGGNDFLDGGPGDDILSGGEGCDVFAVDPTRSESDTITDFEPSVDRFALPAGMDGLPPTELPSITVAGDGSSLIVSIGEADAPVVMTLEGISADETFEFDTSPCSGAPTSAALPVATEPCIVLTLTVADPAFQGGLGPDTYNAGQLGGIAYGDIRTSWTGPGATGNDTLTGSGAVDTLIGDSAVDVDCGSRGGDDTIDGGGGNDVLIGDAGHEVDQASTGGNDTIDGGPGDDDIYGDALDDLDNGSRGGDDILNGEGGSDLVIGDAGHELDDASQGGNDTISGGADDDDLYGDALEAVTEGSRGGDDTINGDAGDDLLVGDGEFIESGSSGGNDTLNGGSEADILIGDAEEDITAGTGGNDVLNGGDGHDTLSGDAGEDLEAGSTGGDDTLNGGPGDDDIYGDAGDDLDGDARAGNDTLAGGSGNDTLWGDAGGTINAAATPGNDTFVFDTAADFDNDTVKDAGVGGVTDTLRFLGVADIVALDARSTVVDGGGADVTATVFTDASKTTQRGTITLEGVGVFAATALDSFADLDATAELGVTTSP